MNGKGKGTAIFIASACVSLVVLGGLLLLFMLYTKAARAEAVKHDVIEHSAYQPTADESLSVVLLGCKKAESLPEVVALLRYDAPTGAVSVIAVPAQAVCTLNGRRDTVAGHYDYEGVRGAVNAVGELLGVEVDRYLRTQETGLSNLVDFLGGVEYAARDGSRLLDGRQTAALLFAPGDNGAPDAARQAALGGQLFRGGFTPQLVGRYEDFAKAVFYNCETNLSQYDFVLRKKGFTGYLEAERLTVSSTALEGSYDAAGGEFLPDEDSSQEIAEALNGISA